MRRKVQIWIAASVVAVAAIGAVAYQVGWHWKKYDFVGTRLMVDLLHPDALIRTTSLAKLPRDVLKAPIARDVLTEDLAFYYEQNEDRLGLNGAIKRIAYEHDLDWSDRVLVGVFNEPADVALWRDSKGALRHYAVVLRRNTLAKVLQQAVTVALKDSQLKQVGDFSTRNGKASVLALEINPRRTLLLITQGERIVVLSDPGLLLDTDNAVVSESRKAVVDWLENDGGIAREFDLGAPPPVTTNAAEAKHTLVLGAQTVALGYASFSAGFKGLRFDYAGSWSSAVWLDQKTQPLAHMINPALWKAAPANPSACVSLPMDWRAVERVVTKADTKPDFINTDAKALAALDGATLACWYADSTLYSPVFITKLSGALPQREATLQSLATWALAAEASPASAAANSPASAGKKSAKSSNQEAGAQIWRGDKDSSTMAASGDYVVFSPDDALVHKVLDTIARRNPAVADQIPSPATTLGVITPRPLSEMAQREMLAALGGSEDANLLAAAQTHLPARIKALAKYPAIRLDLGKAKSANVPAMSAAWQTVNWVGAESAK